LPMPRPQGATPPTPRVDPSPWAVRSQVRSPPLLPSSMLHARCRTAVLQDMSRRVASPRPPPTVSCANPMISATTWAMHRAVLTPTSRGRRKRPRAWYVFPRLRTPDAHRSSSSSSCVVERRRRASSCASGFNLENLPTVSNPRRLTSPPIAINRNSIFDFDRCNFF
jgi:hypothetical protein